MEVLEGDEWFLNMICGKLDDIQMAEVLAREEYAEHFLEQSGYTREKLNFFFASSIRFTQSMTRSVNSNMCNTNVIL